MKQSNSFSLYEILIALFILTIISLNLVNVARAAVREYSERKERAVATAIAHEILTDLRNPTGCISNGDLLVTRNEKDYQISWTITEKAPMSTEIDVEWYVKNQLHTLSISEQLRSRSSLQAIRKNRAPSAIRLYSVSSEEFMDSIITVPATISSGDVVAVVEVTDPNSKSGDIVVASLGSESKDNTAFTFSNNMLKAKTSLAELNKEFQVIIKAVDCFGNQTIKEIAVHVESGNTIEDTVQENLVLNIF